MAFGKGKSKTTHLRRSVEIGRVVLAASPDGAPHPLAALRAQALPLSDMMAQALWPGDPLLPYPDGVEAHRVLRRVQSDSCLNSVWAESRRLVVAAALQEQAKRRRRHLFGLLRHARKNTPAEVAEAVGPVEVARVVAALDGASDRDLFEADRALGGPVVAALVEQACDAYPCPTWVRPDAAVVVTVDHRSLRPGGAVRPGGRAGYLGLLAELTEALRTGQVWAGPLSLSGPVPRGAPVALPVALVPQACLRALRGVRPQDAEVDAITLTIGEKDVVVRAVLVQARPVEARSVRYVLGRDVGYRHTGALCVLDMGKAVDLDQARAVAAPLLAMEAEDGKAAAKGWLEGHVAPAGVEVVETRLFSGAGFLARIAEIGSQIDGLRSEIDRIYTRIGHLKATVCRALGLDPLGVVPPEEDLVASGAWQGLSACVRRAHGRLFKLLGVVGRLKAKRRRLYRQADGVKRSWLGHVSNQEAALAEQWGAAVIAEDFTVITKEKDSPQYKGRAFNKMITDGSLGRYGRLAASKLGWRGIPQVLVPSYYTSSTDVRHGVVDKAQRKRDVFTARVDGARMHADLHAAAVIGLWPFLVPKDSTGDPARGLVRKPLFLPGVAQACRGKGSPVL